MKRRYVIGIDSGTQSTRAMMFDLSGKLICGTTVKHKPLIYGSDGGIYMDEKDLWTSLCKATSDMMSQFKGDARDILAVGLSPHNGTVCFMKNDGTHLMHPISYQDYRTADVDPMPDDCPAWEAWQRLNSRANLVKSIAPDIFEQIEKYASVGGYLGFMLTGSFVDTISNTIGSMPLDREHFCYEKRNWVYDCVGMRKDQLCEAFLPGQVMGRISTKAAEETGLPVGIPLVAGASDKQTEAFGAGAIHDGDTFVSYGTEANLTFVSNRFYSMTRSHFFYSLLSAVPYQWHYTVPMARGYWLISWFKEQFAQDLIQKLEQDGLGRYGAEDVLTEQALLIPAGCEGLMVMPDFLAPRVRPHSSGTVIGFRLLHTRAHLFRAFIEGIAMTLKLNSEYLKAGIPDLAPIQLLYVGGGGSRSDLSMQVTADIFGVPAIRASHHETGSLGAAMCAAIGVGFFHGHEEAVKKMSGNTQTFEPNKKNRELYEDIYQKVFRNLYSVLLPTFETMSKLYR
jgi:xylulokinase